jgi:signal transduction histidine kinase
MSFLSASHLSEHEHKLLGLILFSLLAAISLGADNDFSRSLLITHFGLFLLWQPILKQEQSFSIPSLFILIAFVLVFIIWFNLWISTFWMLLLLSLLTGRIFARGLGRAAYGLAVIILFLQLILITTPSLFNLKGLNPQLQTGLTVSLLALSLLLVLTPRRQSPSPHIDFIRGFMVVLLILFLCMGSVLVAYTTHEQYLPSLVNTIFIASLFLFAMAVLWAPRAGFSGLAQLWERYLLNIGGPFEQWVSRLSAIDANTSIKPENFLQTSINHLIERHWVCGINWTFDDREHQTGRETRHYVTFSDDNLHIRLYTYNSIGPALLLHTKLLLSVLSFYYNAKLQEQQLIKQAHLRAIYETGSKLTHDVKNILQSTQTMAQVLLDKDLRTEDAKQMLAKQLPLLTQRLKTTLEKLQAPATVDSKSVMAKTWWSRLKTRYSGRNITFSHKLSSNPKISIDAYDSITENLLENARSKRIVEPDLDIYVTFESDESSLYLRVCDTGSAIPESITAKLFKESLSSDDGYGIGLYQSHQQAEQNGLKLVLTENTEGSVCFLLSNKLN